jgi:hypothetical protein
MSRRNFEQIRFLLRPGAQEPWLNRYVIPAMTLPVARSKVTQRHDIVTIWWALFA